MKDWVVKLKGALDTLHRSRNYVPDIPEVILILIIKWQALTQY
jgi:hypothetical protein